MFLDNARKFKKPEWEPMGREILTLAVLSILITAPLGAFSIVFLGPRLLEKQEQQNTTMKAPTEDNNEVKVVAEGGAEKEKVETA